MSPRRREVRRRDAARGMRRAAGDASRDDAQALVSVPVLRHSLLLYPDYMGDR